MYSQDDKMRNNSATVVVRIDSSFKMLELPTYSKIIIYISKLHINLKIALEILIYYDSY